ncbi:hypothetical protein MF672_014675 [Actinomadura sp. ATCC 31491]|uniref:Uncharacterized protein n=1 Tax=Actinomadura luzonensis TaxID=2805427 RepID=A0ABT0FRQ4_9ACTN|nr:hypothetical protein [Actinomadura luzonensis]MCK2215021.1 hypothetical protein [Actinomadura luzonensis]
MGSDLRRPAVDGVSVHKVEFIAASARLAELQECSALLRRTRARAEEIVGEARVLLAEAERGGDVDLFVRLYEQAEQARLAYSQILDAYVVICQRITEERQAILQAQFSRRNRTEGLSGAA